MRSPSIAQKVQKITPKGGGGKTNKQISAVSAPLLLLSKSLGFQDHFATRGQCLVYL